MSTPWAGSEGSNVQNAYNTQTWPFRIWAIDLIEEIQLNSSAGHKY